MKIRTEVTLAPDLFPMLMDSANDAELRTSNHGRQLEWIRSSWSMHRPSRFSDFLLTIRCRQLELKRRRWRFAKEIVDAVIREAPVEAATPGRPPELGIDIGMTSARFIDGRLFAYDTMGSTRLPILGQDGAYRVTPLEALEPGYQFRAALAYEGPTYLDLPPMDLPPSDDQTPR